MSEAETALLAPAAQSYFRARGLLYFALLLTLLLGQQSYAFIAGAPIPHWSLWLLGSVLLASLGYWMLSYYPRRKYATTRWCLDAQAMSIHRGIWWRKQLAVPRSRVQHIDVNQGPLQRRYGIAQLVLHTAGTVNAVVALTGFDYAQALALRDELLVQDSADAV